MKKKSESYERLASSSFLAKQLRGLLPKSIITLFALLVLTTYAVPISYMFITALKDRTMMYDPQAPLLWPAKAATYSYEGEEYPVYNVPTEDGMKRWALVEKGREQSSFVDPDKPERGLIEWQGRWRTIDAAWQLSPVWSNFGDVWEGIGFSRLLRNTMLLAGIGVTGTLLSSIAVAYGFSRFRLPGQNILFMVLIGTLMLPRDLIQVPLVRLFFQLGWWGSWLPLLVPQFFANALYVFLLRQHFRVLPKELDEAAVIDGAGPIRILISVIIPQSIPVIATVILLQFFFIWKDFYTPLLYLASRQDLQPLAMGISGFAQGFTTQTQLVMASSFLTIIIPVVVFLFTQGYIMKGAAVLVGRK